MWDDVLLFYRKELAYLTNDDILNIIKIGLKSLSDKVKRKIKKWNKTNRRRSEKAEGEKQRIGSYEAL